MISARVHGSIESSNTACGLNEGFRRRNVALIGLRESIKGRRPVLWLGGIVACQYGPIEGIFWDWMTHRLSLQERGPVLLDAF